MYKKVWQLAAPIILANITVPLLGAVDIAVVGHLPGPQYIAAVGIGATLFSALYFGFVFLRMGTAGLAAIAKGQNNSDESTAWLLRGMLFAFIIGALLYLLKSPISHLCYELINPPDNTLPLTKDYFDIRILSAPAALANFAFLGWMIGMQKPKQALVVQLILNLVNMVLDILLVLYLDYGVKGAAVATVVGEYVGLICALAVARKDIAQYLKRYSTKDIISITKLNHLCAINGNIFIRSLCLQIAFFTFTVKGAQFGDTILAVNAVLMNFQVFMAYALDGFANAAEALTGEAIGKQQGRYFKQTLKATTYWAIGFAIIFTLFYAILWQPIVYLLTDIEVVRSTTAQYIIWAICLPLVSVWSFHLDGIFTGATVTKPMRNSMLFSLIIFLGAMMILVPKMGNHGLWLAFMIFMISRAMTLGLYWPKINAKFN